MDTLPSNRMTRRQTRMAVPKDVDPDVDGLAGDPFDRKPPAIDRRVDILDSDTTPGR